MSKRAISQGAIDWGHWKKQDAWTLKEAIFLLLGLSPKAEYNPFPPQGFREIEETAIRSWQAGKLPTIDNTPLVMFHNEKVEYMNPGTLASRRPDLFPPSRIVTPKTRQMQNLRPEIFIEWAGSKHFEIPLELDVLMHSAPESTRPSCEGVFERFDSNTRSEMHNDKSQSLSQGDPLLTGDEKRELGRLRAKINKFDDLLYATAKVMEHIINDLFSVGELLTKKQLKNILEELGYNTLTTDTPLNSIWRAIPQRYRNAGGPPGHSRTQRKPVSD